MPKESSRIHRVAELLQRELAQIIQQEMRDPRIGMITISDVAVTRDLAQAKVFVSFFDEDPKNIQTTITILNEASGFLRSQLAAKVKLRTTPKLFFCFDDTIARGNRLSRLIADAIAAEPQPKDETKDK